MHVHVYCGEDRRKHNMGYGCVCVLECVYHVHVCSVCAILVIKYDVLKVGALDMSPTAISKSHVVNVVAM